MESGKKGNKLSHSEGATRLSVAVAMPIDVQVRLADSLRKLAIKRYKLGVRRGSAWFRESKTGRPIS